MIKCEVIKKFTYGDFDKIKNLKRHDINKNEKGWLYEKDVFECTPKMADYLTGECGYVLVKVIEVIPDEVEEAPTVEEKPKVKRTRKSRKK